MFDTEESAQLNFLTLVLSFITINGRELPQNLLKSRLSELEIDINGVHHELGSIPDLISKLVKHLYLDQYKPDPALDNYVFVWGKRSKVLFSEESIIQFVVDVPNVINVRCMDWTVRERGKIWLKVSKRLPMVFREFSLEFHCNSTFQNEFDEASSLLLSTLRFTNFKSPVNLSA